MKTSIFKFMIPAILIMFGLAMQVIPNSANVLNLEDADGTELRTETDYYANPMIIDEIGTLDGEEEADTYFYLAVYWDVHDEMHYAVVAMEEGKGVQPMVDAYVQSDETYVGDMFITGYFDVEEVSYDNLDALRDETIGYYAEVMEAVTEYFYGEPVHIWQTDYEFDWICESGEEYAAIRAIDNTKNQLTGKILIMVGGILLAMAFYSKKNRERQDDWLGQTRREEEKNALVKKEQVTYEDYTGTRPQPKPQPQNKPNPYFIEEEPKESDPYDLSFGESSSDPYQFDFGDISTDPYNLGVKASSDDEAQEEEEEESTSDSLFGTDFSSFNSYGSSFFDDDKKDW